MDITYLGSNVNGKDDTIAILKCKVVNPHIAVGISLTTHRFNIVISKKKNENGYCH